jgi:hypothetical protein
VEDVAMIGAHAGGVKRACPLLADDVAACGKSTSRCHSEAAAAASE